jgi:hypothetical protein
MAIILGIIKIFGILLVVDLILIGIVVICRIGMEEKRNESNSCKR